MALDRSSLQKFNLEQAAILLVSQPGMGQEVLVQVFSGFGAKNVTRAASIEDSKQLLARGVIDLIVVDAVVQDGDGVDLINWLRREGKDPNRFTPLILVEGHTPPSRVARARDCGAHFVIRKPLTPSVMLERILWIARQARPFVECDEYAGPDRRFKYEGPPPETEGRRSDDLIGDLEGPAGSNLGQEEVDTILKPQRASL